MLRLERELRCVVIDADLHTLRFRASFAFVVPFLSPYGGEWGTRVRLGRWLSHTKCGIGALLVYRESLFGALDS